MKRLCTIGGAAALAAAALGVNLALAASGPDAEVGENRAFSYDGIPPGRGIPSGAGLSEGRSAAEIGMDRRGQRHKGMPSSGYDDSFHRLRR